jgi:hypothetical protein
VLKSVVPAPPSQNSVDTAVSNDSAPVAIDSQPDVKTLEKPSDEGSDVAKNVVSHKPESCRPAISISKLRVPFLPPFQILFFDHFHDTLPHITRDTPRTMPRMKVTLNSRVKRLFSKLARGYRKIGSERMQD